ncbi:MAG: amidohydrolase [Alphaproteobacteria bacterium]|nr:amidohydrolase [Alphaproteobacteria bacterium]
MANLRPMTRRASAGATRAGKIRASLDHPVVDSDGHMIEFVPAIIDYVRQVAGPAMVERYVAFLKGGPAHSFEVAGERRATGWHGMTPAERLAKRVIRPSYAVFPARNTRDRATAMMPALLRARLDELGIDFLILYPTLGIHLLRHPDDELRRAGCRAINLLHADLYREHADRMTPAAIIPMHTPAEAIAELDFTVKTLGYKVAMIAGGVSRPVAELRERAPDLARHGLWVDSLGLESAYAYDPVWARCVELGVAATAHSGAMGWGARNSTTNFTYNHIGHFAAAGEAFCKALVLGGVTRRFPTLNFAFLEGGAGWAVHLYNSLVEHWEKRNRRRIEHELDARHIDAALLSELADRYGPGQIKRHRDALATRGGMLYEPVEREAIDDWAAAGVKRAEDVRDRFVPNFYFGCEADDRMTAIAFNPKMNHLGARLQPIFGSDIGHFDVADIRDVLVEAYELVEDGLIDADDFRDFTFTNVVQLHGRANPDFFTGTTVAAAAAKVLRSRRRA